MGIGLRTDERYLRAKPIQQNRLLFYLVLVLFCLTKVAKYTLPIPSQFKFILPYVKKYAGREQRKTMRSSMLTAPNSKTVSDARRKINTILQSIGSKKQHCHKANNIYNIQYISFRINGYRASIKLVKFLLSYFSLTTICEKV